MTLQKYLDFQEKILKKKTKTITYKSIMELRSKKHYIIPSSNTSNKIRKNNILVTYFIYNKELYYLKNFSKLKKDI